VITKSRLCKAIIVCSLLAVLSASPLLNSSAKEVYDVSGAGDTVIATIGAMLAAGADLPAATTIANQAAGIVVGKLGTAVVLPEELRD